MRETPAHLIRGLRPVVPEFDPNERLYRRLPPKPDDEGVEIDDVELPDISVFRSKFCHGPKDVLFSKGGQFDNWGVFSFPVKAVQRQIMQAGASAYSLEPQHVPYAERYPHSEVWAFDGGGVHVDADRIRSMDR